MPLTPITGSGQLMREPATSATLLGFAVFQATEVLTGATVTNGVPTPFTSTGTVYYRTVHTTVGTDAGGHAPADPSESG